MIQTGRLRTRPAPCDAVESTPTKVQSAKEPVLGAKVYSRALTMSVAETDTSWDGVMTNTESRFECDEFSLNPRYPLL